MGDFGKRIRLVFVSDGGGSELFDIVSADLITRFRLKEDNYGTYIYPTSVTQGANNSELYINFADFNNAQYPMTLEYLGGGALRGKDLTVDAFSIVPSVSWWNLNRKGNYESLEITSVEITGEIAIGFNGKLYLDEYLTLTVEVNGTVADATYEYGYLKEYLEITTVGVNGIYADANGTPI